MYLDPFIVEKIGISLQGHFSGSSQFGKLGSRTFWGHSEIEFIFATNAQILV
jgi:hypothetical protein